jgi:hypothetical protein
MSKRILKVIDNTPQTLEDLFEDLPEKPQYTYTPINTKGIVERVSDKMRTQEISTDTEEDTVNHKLIIVEICIGFLLLVFGAFNASSIFSNYTMYNGFMATFFYIWQFAWIFEISGLIMIYDGLKNESIVINNIFKPMIDNLRRKNKKE